MKSKYYVFLFLACCQFGLACSKDASTDSNAVNHLFTDTVSVIKQTEPLLLSFNTGNNTAIVTWQVFPNKNYTISPAGVYATLSFSKGGTYNITATANATQATYVVTVSDSVYQDIDTGFSLRASQIVNILPYQNISFSVNNPPNINDFIWTTTGNVSSINTSKNPATFSFGNGKTGTVHISSGNQSRTRTVWLADPSINNPSVDTVPFIFSDKLAITPSVQKDIQGKKQLVLTANTHYNYQCYTDSVLSLVDSSNQQYTLNYGGVVMASIPCSSIKPATSINSIVNMSVGTFPFTVNYGNDTYTGTVTLSATGVFSFNWISNKVVSIYPLVVQ